MLWITNCIISKNRNIEKNNILFQMFGVFARLTVAITILAILLCMVGDAKANYKNAPMNGIMFGKRGPTGNNKIKTVIFYIINV